MNCFNCGDTFWLNPDTEADRTHEAQGFCSPECMNADDARLIEGNKIISQAEVQLSDVNAARLQAAGMGNLMAGIKFGTKQSEAAPQRYTQEQATDTHQRLDLHQEKEDGNE